MPEAGIGRLALLEHDAGHGRRLREGGRLPATSGARPPATGVVLRHAIAEGVTVEPPTVSAIYKEISPESVRDRNGVLDPLRKAMESRKVPQAIIDNLFETFDAAPSAASD